MTDPNLAPMGAPKTSPSWIPSIALGAFVTYAGLFLLGPVAQTQVGGCLGCFAFLPFGILPVWFARRRDPGIGAGQGFAIAFIAVGLGAVLWAATAIASGEFGDFDLDAVRQGMIEQQQQAPPDQRLTDEQIDEIVEAMEAFIPYAPAVLALVMTVLGSIVGLITGAILRRPEQDR